MVMEDLQVRKVFASKECFMKERKMNRQLFKKHFCESKSALILAGRAR